MDIRQTARLALGVGTLLFASLPLAAQAQTIRFLHNETDPPSIEFFNKAIKEFEAKNPGIKVEMEAASTDGRLQKVMASISTKTMPDVLKILPEERFEFVRKGFIVPLDDLIDKIGRDDFVTGSLVPIDGKIYDVPYTLGNFSVLWYREDLFKAAGVAVPTNWDETLAAATKLNKDGIYGYVFPGGKNRQTSQLFAALMWSAGGTFFDKDFNVTFDNPGTVKALEYMQKIAKVSPPGLGSYSAGDMVNVFLSGQVAMAVYAARVPANVAINVPAMIPKLSGAVAPQGPANVTAKFVSANSYAVSSPTVGGKNVDASKKFVSFLLEKEQIQAFSLTAFPHLIPPLKSIQEQVIKAGAPLIGGKEELARLSYDTSNGMDFDAEAGAKIVDGKVVRSGVINPYMGAVVARGIPAMTLQRVVLNGESPADAAKWGAAEMKRVVDEIKK